MLTSFADEDLVLDAISAGAAGYVLKQVGTDDLLRAVRAVGRGDAVLDPTVTRQLLARVRRAKHDAHGAAFQDLSERELAILAHDPRHHAETQDASDECVFGFHLHAPHQLDRTIDQR